MVGKEDDRLSYLGFGNFSGAFAVKLREGGNDLENHFVPFFTGNWIAGFRGFKLMEIIFRQLVFQGSFFVNQLSGRLFKEFSE